MIKHSEEFKQESVRIALTSGSEDAQVRLTLSRAGPRAPHGATSTRVG